MTVTSKNIDIYGEIAQLRAKGKRAALATIIHIRGSVPSFETAKILVKEDGSTVGTIGGGCGESEVWQDAMDTMADGIPRLTVVDLTEPIDGDDKICGGVMEIFVERIVD